jgi:hypothetical protein
MKFSIVDMVSCHLERSREISNFIERRVYIQRFLDSARNDKKR